MKDLFAIRRENLKKLVLDKFGGNRSALSRATGVHHNHINLLLSDNETYARNLGEELARRIEVSIGMPEGWFDQGHSRDTKHVTLRSVPIDQGMSRALVESEDVQSAVITDALIKRIESSITDVSNLIIATVSTGEMAPVLPVGCTVLIDRGYKSASTDGVYVLTRGDAAFIRSVRRHTDGSQLLYAANPDYKSDKPEVLKGMKVVGRVVMRVGLERL